MRSAQHGVADAPLAVPCDASARLSRALRAAAIRGTLTGSIILLAADLGDDHARRQTRTENRDC